MDNCNQNTQVPTYVALSPAVTWAFLRAARARALDSICSALLSQELFVWAPALTLAVPQSLCNCFGSWKAKDAYLSTHKVCSVVTLTQYHHGFVWTQCFPPPKCHVRFFLEIRIRCSELSYYAWSVLNSACHWPPSLCLCFVSVLVPRVLARTRETFRLLPKHLWLQMHASFFQESTGKECKMTWRCSEQEGVRLQPAPKSNLLEKAPVPLPRTV